MYKHGSVRGQKIAGTETYRITRLFISISTRVTLLRTHVAIAFWLVQKAYSIIRVESKKLLSQFLVANVFVW